LAFNQPNADLTRDLAGKTAMLKAHLLSTISTSQIWYGIILNDSKDLGK